MTFVVIGGLRVNKCELSREKGQLRCNIIVKFILYSFERNSSCRIVKN